MSVKAVREFDGKLMLSRWLKNHGGGLHWDRFVQVLPSTVMDKLPSKPEYEWLNTERLVVKPDQLIKRRGKAGLIKLNATFPEVMDWVNQRMQKDIEVEGVKGVLDHFLIEQFYPHQGKDEYYIAIIAKRDCDEILFHHEGGVDVGDVDAKAVRLQISVGAAIQEADIEKNLLVHVPDARRATLRPFIKALYEFFVQLHYSYLEINPLLVTDNGEIVPLDMAAKIDETAKFECGSLWGKVQFPPPFGRPLTAAEAYIQELDSKTGSSLKLTILNPKGRIWTLVAGGGASVIYADTIADLGYANELANYGNTVVHPMKYSLLNILKHCWN